MNNARSRRFREPFLRWLLNLALAAVAVALTIWVEGKLSG